MDSIVDAIGIWVLAGESIEKWLNTIESKLSIVMNQGFSGLVGFITVVGGPLLFVFFDAADRMAIGEKLYYQAKVCYHAKVRGFRDSIMRKGKRT